MAASNEIVELLTPMEVKKLTLALQAVQEKGGWGGITVEVKRGRLDRIHVDFCILVRDPHSPEDG